MSSGTYAKGIDFEGESWDNFYRKMHITAEKIDAC